jgi:hypothetical protein
MIRILVLVIVLLGATSSSACSSQPLLSQNPAFAVGFLDTAEAYHASRDQYSGIKVYDRTMADDSQDIQMNLDYAEAYSV